MRPAPGYLLTGFAAVSLTPKTHVAGLMKAKCFGQEPRLQNLAAKLQSGFCHSLAEETYAS